MFQLSSSGDWKATEDWLARNQKNKAFMDLDAYGKAGVEALRRATPVDTGDTAESWGYKIVRRNGSVKIEWYNTHTEGGPPIAVLIQYGHATRNGGYVQGRDYINPAMRPIFDKIAQEVWKKVIK